MKDAYEALGVPRTASDGEIREAYDRLGNEAPESAERFYEIKQAYETLSDPDRRAAYDAELTGWSSPSSPEPPREDGHGVEHESRHPVDRLTRGLPHSWRIAIDWIVTIVGAIAIVLAIKAWVINPYRIPSSSMEPTLHCARPGSGCEAHFSDRVLANRFIYRFRSPKRGEIIVFKTPPEAAVKCGSGGTFVKRLIGLPGDTVSEKTWHGQAGTIFIDGHPLIEPYIKPDRRDSRTGTWKVPLKSYFFMGDNRAQSCDSRDWGAVPRGNLIGEVFAVYWPPNRIGFR